MSFTTQISKDSTRLIYFVRMKPRIKIAHGDFTNLSGSVYYISFPYIVDLVENVGADLSLGSSSSLSAGEFYYDQDAGRLYIRKSDSTAPDSDDYFVLTFRLHFCSQEMLMTSDPLDSASETVEWDGSLDIHPEIQQGGDIKSFGFYAVGSTSFTVRNVDDLQPYLYDISTRYAEVEVWGVAGRVASANISKIFTASAGTFNVRKNEITFRLYDKSNTFNTKVSNGSGENYFDSTVLNDIDPAYRGAPIRKIFGRVRGFTPVNVSYVGGGTTSDNRDWVVCHDSCGYAPIDITGTGAFSHSGPYHLLNVGTIANAQKFKPGDLVRAYDSGGSCWSYVHSISGTTIQVYPEGAYGLTSGTGHLEKSFVQRVFMIQDDQLFIISPGYWTHATFSQGTRGFTLDANAEAFANGVSGTPATFDPANGDKLFVDVEGDLTLPTIDGTPFYSGNTAPIRIYSGLIQLYAFIKSVFGMDESEINTDSFVDADAVVGNFGTNYVYGAQVGFAVPQMALGDFPTYKEVIDKILFTMMCNAYVNEDGKFTVAPLVNPASEDTDLIGEEIMNFDAEMGFDDIAQVRVLNNFSETTIVTQRTNDADGFSEYTGTNFESIEYDHWCGSIYDYRASNEAQYLHKNPTSTDLETYLDTGVDIVSMLLNYGRWPTILHIPDWYNNRLASLYGDRTGTIRMEISRTNFTRNAFDVIDVTSRFLPGKSPLSDQTRTMQVASLTKDPNRVELVLDDLRGINENSGDWS